MQYVLILYMLENIYYSHMQEKKHEYLDKQILSKIEHVKYLYKIKLKRNQGGFPDGSVVESLPASEETRVPSLT